MWECVLSVRVLISLQSKINALRMGEKREYNSNNDCKTTTETVSQRLYSEDSSGTKGHWGQEWWFVSGNLFYGAHNAGITTVTSPVSELWFTPRPDRSRGTASLQYKWFVDHIKLRGSENLTIKRVMGVISVRLYSYYIQKGVAWKGGEFKLHACMIISIIFKIQQW